MVPTRIGESTQQVERANELYWSSSESVNQIANQLGLSKGSLYAAIKPKPSDSMCPTCGSQLGYANRTALERGTLSCQGCAHEFTVRPERTKEPLVPLIQAPHAGAEANTLNEPAQQQSATGPRSTGTMRSHRSRQLVLGTTLLALGTGLLLSRLVRRS